MKDRKFVLSLVTLLTIAIIGFLAWYIPRYSTHALKATESCTNIYKEKAPGYFTDGVDRYIFNKKLNTCLMLNVLADTTTGKSRLVIVDMINDDVLFAHTVSTGETVDGDLGITYEQALEKARAFGFIIF
jgi:hypothetical protein